MNHEEIQQLADEVVKKHRAREEKRHKASISAERHRKKACMWCGKVVENHRLFCSIECRDAFNARQKEREWQERDREEARWAR